MTNPTPRASDLVLVPREPTVAMEDAAKPECGGYCPRCDADVEIKTGMQVDIYRAMLAAAPQPPALGGDIKVLAAASFAKNGNIQCWSLSRDHASLRKLEGEGHQVVELIDRAHLAPLLAEIERLKSESFEGLYNEVIDERDRLQARIAELEAGQPATAKVVLPGRMQPRDPYDSEANQWNDCLDATAKLNGVTPDDQ